MARCVAAPYSFRFVTVQCERNQSAVHRILTAVLLVCEYRIRVNDIFIHRQFLVPAIVISRDV